MKTWRQFAKSTDVVWRAITQESYEQIQLNAAKAGMMLAAISLRQNGNTLDAGWIERKSQTLTIQDLTNL